jgi:hypothetical protein
VGVKDRFGDLESSKPRNLGSAPLWFLEMVETLRRKSAIMVDAFQPLKLKTSRNGLSRAGHVIHDLTLYTRPEDNVVVVVIAMIDDHSQTLLTWQPPTPWDHVDSLFTEGMIQTSPDIPKSPLCRNVQRRSETSIHR